MRHVKIFALFVTLAASIHAAPQKRKTSTIFPTNKDISNEQECEVHSALRQLPKNDPFSVQPNDLVWHSFECRFGFGCQFWRH